VTSNSQTATHNHFFGFRPVRVAGLLHIQQFSQWGILGHCAFDFPQNLCNYCIILCATGMPVGDIGTLLLMSLRNFRRLVSDVTPSAKRVVSVTLCVGSPFYLSYRISPFCFHDCFCGDGMWRPPNRHELYTVCSSHRGEISN
jgi:hypothetical protein